MNNQIDIALTSMNMGFCQGYFSTLAGSEGLPGLRRPDGGQHVGLARTAGISENMKDYWFSPEKEQNSHGYMNSLVGLSEQKVLQVRIAMQKIRITNGLHAWGRSNEPS